jgi:hypothetical protein
MRPSKRFASYSGTPMPASAPIIPATAPTAPIPATAATIGPAAASGPRPGIASTPTPVSQPNTPPETPPTIAPAVAPSGAFVFFMGKVFGTLVFLKQHGNIRTTKSGCA